MNHSETKKLVVTTGVPSANVFAERVSLVNEAGQQISTKTDAELNSRYETEVSLIIEGVGRYYVPMGIDATNSVVYGTGDASTSTLSKCTDPEMSYWIPLYNFGATHTIGLVQVTAAGSILVLTTTASAGYIYRSTDGGLTFTQVLTGTYLGATRRTACQLTNDSIFFGEYTIASGTYTLSLWKSTNDGANWTAVKTWPTAGDQPSSIFRHIHFMRADPFVTNRLWMGVGDGTNLTTQSAISYSDDDGATFTTIGSGSQQWRAVDLLFTADAVWWGMDAPSDAQHIYRWDRNTQAVTSHLADAVGSLYYGVADGAGRGLYVSVYETGTNQTANTRVFTGYMAAGAAEWKPMWTSLAPPTCTHSEIFPFGPLADGTIILGVRHTVGTDLVQDCYRVRLIDGKAYQSGPTNGPNQRRARIRSVKVGTVNAGPPPAAFGTGTVTAGANNRIMFNKVIPVADIQVKYLYWYTGATGGGNVIGSIWDCDDSGDPVNQMATSVSTSVGATATAKVLTFDRPVTLFAGRVYWASLQFDTAGCTALGQDVKISITQQHKYSDAVAFPAPNPLGATPAATVRQLCMVLVAG